MNLGDAEVITINDYRQLYDELEDGHGYFIENHKHITDDEVTNSKIFNTDYVAENNYTHVAWYK